MMSLKCMSLKYHPNKIPPPETFVPGGVYIYEQFYKHDRLSGIKEDSTMEFFGSAIETLKVLVIALGAGLGVWGVINLLEGYGNDNPGAKSQGMKQLMAGGGVALIGMQLIPVLANLFS